MTACTNHGGKARRVVTAALVGVLSVGTVPMVALATGANDGIQQMAADWYTDVTVTRATDGSGAVVSNPNQATFTAKSGKFLVPVEVKNDYATTYVDLNEYTLKYTDENGTQIGQTISGTNTANDLATTKTAFEAKGVGTYYVQIFENGTSRVKIAFKYVEQSYEGAYVYEEGTDLTDTSDTEFVYTGKDQGSNVGIALSDGSVVNTSGKMVIRDSDGVMVYNRTNASVNGGVTDPGEYTAYLDTDGGKQIAIKFTVEKLDLSTAALTLGDLIGTQFPQNGNTAAQKAAILGMVQYSGETLSSSSQILDNSVVSNLEISSVTGPEGINWFNKDVKGEYTFTISEMSDDPNVEGTATVTFSYLDNSVFSDPDTKLMYGNKVITSTGINLSLLDGESFDASKVKVVYGDQTFSGDQLDITYKKGTKVVDASALSETGTYAMDVRVKPFQTFEKDLWLGGTEPNVPIVVSGATVSTDDLAFFFDGKLTGDTAKATYDGTDQLEKVSVSLKDSEGNELVEGTDYKLVVKGQDDKEVDSVVDANTNGGCYTVQVEPLTFDFETPGSGDTLNLYVNAVQLDRILVDTDSMLYAVDDKTGGIPHDVNASGDPIFTGTDNNEYYLPYTGSAVALPGLKYEVVNNGKYSYVALDPSLYNVVSIEFGNKVVEEAVEEGDYTVTIALTDEAGSNYTLGAGAVNQVSFTVRAFGHFTDVASDAWYAVPVEKAYKNWYVNGIAGTDLFAPNADITRADVACILFNMAGSKNAQIGNDEFGFSEVDGYITGFDDVDGHAYYAQAIAWAHASGVVNGHDGNFRPTDKITREEFASMLANFAKVKGDYKASDGSALAGLSDAASVSDWAEANVAWAVENGIMGNGGSVNATAQITRAEVAAMAVNYQPEPLVEVADR